MKIVFLSFCINHLIVLSQSLPSTVIATSVYTTSIAQMGSVDFELQVFTGLWRDWSRGSILGHILTLSRSDANFLIAFTAFFIAFVATRFWRIVSLLCHRHFSTAEPRHTLHHQQQVILRNKTTPEAAFLSLVQLWWAWRKLGFRRRIQLLSVSGLAAFTVATFTVAGGFSASISSAVGDKVLVSSSNCGFLVDPVNNATLGNALEKITSEHESNYANYAQQCYSTDRSGLLNCNRFVKDHLPSIATYSTPCPFSSNICRSNTSNIRLDSGHINVNDGLGLNTDVMKKTSFRYVLTCAPLVTKGYTSVVNTSSGDLVRYHYGRRDVGEWGEYIWQDFIFQSSSVASQYAQVPERKGDGIAGNRFKLSCSQVLVQDRKPNSEVTGNIFVPDLSRSDGDVSIAFLEGNGVYFDKPMDDDWYRATVPGTKITDGYGTSVYYIPEEPASPMGCVEQYQYCHAEQCGPLASFNDAIAESAPHFNSTPAEIDLSGQPPVGNLQAMSLYWLASILNSGFVTAPSLLSKLGPLSLASQSLFEGGVQYVSFPQDQRKKDVENWANIILAGLQSSFLSVVLNPADPELEGLLAPPTDEFQKAMCNSQKIRSTAYASFSLFGLLCTYIVGGLIIVTSAAMEPVLRCLQRRYKYQNYEQLEWATNEHLQLHRLTQEQLGYGQWSKCTESIPMPGADELLGSLDIQDLNHPTITKRPEEPEKTGLPEAVDPPSNTSTATERTSSLQESSAGAQHLDEDDTVSVDEAQHIFVSNNTTTTMLAYE
ncbi:hypothetical protein HD806DRAFT_551031 [Xylariaceae sp. AK1471]|nr:hypothetical protein HD806DRAFT_551031 [Xylariaceae sp. AK1471]